MSWYKGYRNQWKDIIETVAAEERRTVCLVKMLPVLDIPLWLFIWIAVIAMIKLINIISVSFFAFLSNYYRNVLLYATHLLIIL